MPGALTQLPTSYAPTECGEKPEGIGFQGPSYRPTKPRGRVAKWVPGTQAQLKLIASLCSGLHPDNQKFVIHILSSMRVRSGKNGNLTGRRDFIPASYLFRQTNFRNTDWKELQRRGVIDVHRYSRHGRRSDAFRIEPAVRAKLLEARLPLMGQQHCRINLVTGKPTVRLIGSPKKDPRGRKLPPLIRDAIEHIGRCPFNRREIEEHLERLKKDVLQSARGTSQLHIARARYATDLSCFVSLFDQDAQPLNDELSDYQPAYSATKTGRISQMRGGLQNSSRALKAVAYSGIGGVRNYDLKASQARILQHEMSQRGRTPAFLNRYNSEENAKECAAKQIGVSVDTWKDMLYALIMNANLPPLSQIRLKRYARGSVRKAIVSDVGFDALYETYERFLDYVEDFPSVLSQWQESIVDDLVDKSTWTAKETGKQLLRNATGIQVRVDELARKNDLYQLRASLAAFILQGLEAAVIHNLTCLSSTYEYRVVSNEHDGLVTIGTIPDAAVKRAVSSVGLPTELIELIEKPF